jgi:protein CpxP
MRSLSIRFIPSCAAAALLGVGLMAAPLGASAQQSSPPPAQTQMAPGSATPSTAKSMATPSTKSSKVEARIKSLHAQLKITPDEETQWAAVADAMRDNAQQMDQLVQQREADRSGRSALDDMKSYQAIVQAHADGMQKLVPAFEALYDKMPSAQQKIADGVFNQRTAARAVHASKKG